jgi:protein phosphatase inhibitor 2
VYAHTHKTELICGNFATGILKKRSTFPEPQLSPSPTREDIQTSPTFAQSPAETKELTLQNTLQNAGRVPRAAPGSRRQSSGSGVNGSHVDEEASPRLKWDEANLYLTEQERTAKMKIDEPKTPYVPHYNPDEEEDDEVEMDVGIHASELAVDELDMTKGKRKGSGAGHREDDIPDLELGEPTEDLGQAAAWSGQGGRIVVQPESPKSPEKHVVVGSEAVDEDEPMTSEEAKEKHREFEKMRKRHYEMSCIKDLLG